MAALYRIGEARKAQAGNGIDPHHQIRRCVVLLIGFIYSRSP
jgi:hypothetical protein